MIAGWSALGTLMCCAAWTGVVPDGEVGMPCQVTGVVTAVVVPRTCSVVIAAPSDPNGKATYVTSLEFAEEKLTYIGARDVQRGDLIEIQGEWARMMLNPGIVAKRIEWLGQQELGACPVRRLADLRTGHFDNVRSAVEGVVRSVMREGGDVKILLGTPDGTVAAKVKGEVSDFERLVDRDVRVSGLAMSKFNHRSEFIDVWIGMASPSDIEEIAPQTEGHRVKREGTVVAVESPDLFFVESANQGLKVRTWSGSLPTPGARVEVEGFTDMENGVRVLNDAVWMPLETAGRLPEPMAVATEDLVRLPLKDDLSFVDMQFRLVRVEGRCLKPTSGRVALKPRHDHAPAIVLEGAGVTETLVREAAFEPVLEVTGVCDMIIETQTIDGNTYGVVKSVRLIVNEPSAVRILPDGDYRRRKFIHLLGFAGWLLLALVLVAVVFALRSRARVQRELRHSELITAERKRMAIDLHDTVEQYLACAKMVLTGTIAMRDLPEAARSDIVMAADVLAHAKREVRDTVMNLRVDAALSTTLPQMLQETANRVTKSGATQVRLCLRGIPDGFNGSRMLDIIAIVNEAVTNAIKHGQASLVQIVSDPTPAGFSLRIRNNGMPFDASRQLGPETGHFGLTGMMERAERSGVALTIGVVEEWTEVRLEIALERKERGDD